MKIYIVEGSTGEYADRRDWLVKGYFDRTKAEQHAIDAENWLKGYGIDNWCKNFGRIPVTNPYDPCMDVDYTGTMYYVVEVEVD
jgi:hypothetical protein